MGKAEKVAVVWLRRDLRLFDNAALYHALNSGSQVLIMFIFDKNILDKLQDKKDKRVDFIYRQLEKINSELHQYNSSLLVYHNTPKKAFEELLSNFDVQEVFTNRDYEPYALERDREINDLLESKNIPFQTFKDQVIFERSEVMKPDGSPYTVFTPYSNKWKERLHQESIPEYPSESRLDHLLKRAKVALPSLENMGF
ncbi:deoxyribodipyrimidine photo-lyase, partial [Longispora fulva]|uniref:deoxyribodipyrimidine photo-lyase n=2 Tax=Bacteria TaxID=2 RepID=UPI00363BC7E3